jgi:ATP-dependent DNA ligase
VRAGPKYSLVCVPWRETRAGAYACRRARFKGPLPFRPVVLSPSDSTLRKRAAIPAGMLTRRIRTDGFVDPCIPTRATAAPAGTGWAHEIKHDGYRLIVRREGDAVRLFTRRGFDWTERYPAIAAAAACRQSFTLDGEAVVAGTRRRPAS